MIKRLQIGLTRWLRIILICNPDLSKDQIANKISNYITLASTVQGAALSLPGAIPGLGTAAQVTIEVSTLSTDVSLIIRNEAYLAFAMGYLYGIKGRELLIQNTLIIMGLSVNALVISKRGIIRIGNKVLSKQFKKKFSAKVLQKINKKVGITVLTKYGTKRGGVALGKLIPFGIGVVVGGGFNYFTMRLFASYTKKVMKLKYT
jgi:hypothetical protein